MCNFCKVHHPFHTYQQQTAASWPGPVAARLVCDVSAPAHAHCLWGDGALQTLQLHIHANIESPRNSALLKGTLTFCSHLESPLYQKPSPKYTNTWNTRSRNDHTHLLPKPRTCEAVISEDKQFRHEHDLTCDSVPTKWGIVRWDIKSKIYVKARPPVVILYPKKQWVIFLLNIKDSQRLP